MHITLQISKIINNLTICIPGKNGKHGRDYLYTEEFPEALDESLRAKLAD